MNILMMSNTYAPIVGGIERSIQSFAEEFRKRGHDVRIVTSEYEGRPEHEDYVIRIPALKKVFHTDFSINLPIPGVISNLMEQYKPDLVHSHHPFFVGDLALRLCGQYGLPHVYTYHTMFEWYTAMLGTDSEAVQRFLVALATGYCNLADQVFVPSESVAGILEERKVETPIAVVPTGVNTAHFASGNGEDMRRYFGIPTAAFVAGHLGRLSPEKNLNFLAESMAQFLVDNPEAHFMVIGTGPSEDSVKELMREKGVDARVHFTGLLKGADLVNAYHAMDVFVFASKSETQGLVVTEAMAAGLYVVALDAPGVREVVRDKENGRLLMEEDTSAFAQAVTECMQMERGAREPFLKAARATAEEFSVSNCATRALAVYEKARGAKLRSNAAETEWPKLIERLKTEWGMLKNMGRAAGAAVLDSGRPSDESHPQRAA